MKRWFVIQVYAGYENTVKADLLKRIEEVGLQDMFGEGLIPSAKMKHFFDASDAMKDQQLFPGYMLVEMEPTPQARRLLDTTSRILRTLGTLSQKEFERVDAQMAGEVIVPTTKHEFEVGKVVEIQSGPFEGFDGMVESVHEENEKLTVMVSIFGGMTPVELNFDQVKR
jgi:transcription termination/antitermination protein NusG